MWPEKLGFEDCDHNPIFRDVKKNSRTLKPGKLPLPRDLDVDQQSQNAFNNVGQDSVSLEEGKLQESKSCETEQLSSQGNSLDKFCMCKPSSKKPNKLTSPKKSSGDSYHTDSPSNCSINKNTVTSNINQDGDSSASSLTSLYPIQKNPHKELCNSSNKCSKPKESVCKESDCKSTCNKKYLQEACISFLDRKLSKKHIIDNKTEIYNLHHNNRHNSNESSQDLYQENNEKILKEKCENYLKIKCSENRSGSRSDSEASFINKQTKKNSHQDAGRKWYDLVGECSKDNFGDESSLCTSSGAEESLKLHKKKSIKCPRKKKKNSQDIGTSTKRKLLAEDCTKSFQQNCPKNQSINSDSDAKENFTCSPEKKSSRKDLCKTETHKELYRIVKNEESHKERCAIQHIGDNKLSSLPCLSNKTCNDFCQQQKTLCQNSCKDKYFKAIEKYIESKSGEQTEIDNSSVFPDICPEIKSSCKKKSTSKCSQQKQSLEDFCKVPNGKEPCHKTTCRDKSLKVKRKQNQNGSKGANSSAICRINSPTENSCKTELSKTPKNCPDNLPEVTGTDKNKCQTTYNDHIQLNEKFTKHLEKKCSTEQRIDCSPKSNLSLSIPCIEKQKSSEGKCTDLSGSTSSNTPIEDNQYTKSNTSNYCKCVKEKSFNVCMEKNSENVEKNNNSSEKDLCLKWSQYLKLMQKEADEQMYKNYKDYTSKESSSLESGDNSNPSQLCVCSCQLTKSVLDNSDTDLSTNPSECIQIYLNKLDEEEPLSFIPVSASCPLKSDKIEIAVQDNCLSILLGSGKTDVKVTPNLSKSKMDSESGTKKCFTNPMFQSKSIDSKISESKDQVTCNKITITSPQIDTKEYLNDEKLPNQVKSRKDQLIRSDSQTITSAEVIKALTEAHNQTVETIKYAMQDIASKVYRTTSEVAAGAFTRIQSESAKQLDIIKNYRQKEKNEAKSSEDNENADGLRQKIIRKISDDTPDEPSMVQKVYEQVVCTVSSAVSVISEVVADKVKIPNFNDASSKYDVPDPCLRKKNVSPKQVTNIMENNYSYTVYRYFRSKFCSMFTDKESSEGLLSRNTSVTSVSNDPNDNDAESEDDLMNKLIE